MARGRPSCFKKSDSRTREILLNAKVDIRGNIRSWRDIYNDPTIMFDLGLYRRKDYESNKELVEEAVALAAAVGRPIASIAEAKTIMSLGHVH